MNINFSILNLIKLMHIYITNVKYIIYKTETSKVAIKPSLEITY